MAWTPRPTRVQGHLRRLACDVGGVAALTGCGATASPGSRSQPATRAATEAARPAGRCRGQRGQVVLRGPRVTITVGSSSGVSGFYRACLRAADRVRTINAAGEYEPLMPGPALATGGAWVAAAIGNDTDPNLDFVATQIVAIDLADGHTRDVKRRRRRQRRQGPEDDRERAPPDRPSGRRTLSALAERPAARSSWARRRPIPSYAG